MISKKDIQVFEEKQRILLQVKEFICLLPHPDLREYISNYNITFPTKALMPDAFTVMPCGCSTLAVKKDDKKLFVDLQGPVTKPYIVGSRANQLEMMVTIEFKPAGLFALTGIDQNELTDRTFPFEAVDPVLNKLVSETVEKAGSACEMVSGLDILLLKNIFTAYHPELKRILQNINDYAGNVTIKKLSSDIHYSERQLNRIFKQYVGTNAKSFSRLIRINNSFRLLKKSHNSLTFVSDVAGYHDLSHFVHDFKIMCGITPREYRSNMSGFYNNTTKF